MRRQLLTGLLMIAVFTVITGLLYPLAMTGIAQGAFRDKANGSLVKENGVVVGSRWIGQNFTAARYFHPRPSTAGDGYDASASSGSNLGPTNPKLLYEVGQRAVAYRRENHLAANAKVPVDAVTASASGLDPDISVANARIQARRVAQVRRLPLDEVLRLVRAHTDQRSLSILGEPGVNVLELNLALNRIH